MSENNDIIVELLICDAMAITLPPNAHKSLSSSECQRLDNMSGATQARLFLLGRYLLRQRLGRLLNQSPDSLDISLDHRGKPLLAGGHWQFNLSHSGSLLALALSPHAAVGVDLECRQLERHRIDRLAQRYLATSEQHWLAASSQPARDFQQLWTVKEAVLKADGGGIANNLDQVEWRPGHPVAHFNGRHYRLYQEQPAGASLTLAVAGDGHRLHRLSVSDCAPALEIVPPQPNLAINPSRDV